MEYMICLLFKGRVYNSSNRDGPTEGFKSEYIGACRRIEERCMNWCVHSVVHMLPWSYMSPSREQLRLHLLFVQLRPKIGQPNGSVRQFVR